MLFYSTIKHNISLAYDWVYQRTSYLRFLLKRMEVDDIGVLASSLSYTTILSLVPVLAVLISVFSLFPGFADLRNQLMDFVIANMMPQFGDALKDNINSFIANASKTTVVGLVTLVIISLLLIRRIDLTLNKIWHTTLKRSRVTTFAVYWTVLTLGPILLGISIAISSSLTAERIFGDGVVSSGLGSFSVSLIPMFLSFVIFTIMYMAVPVTKVKFFHASAGAFFAALAQELVRRLFTFYIINFSNYDIIYGAVAALPVLMVWTHINWSVVLIGAEISATIRDYLHNKRIGLKKSLSNNNEQKQEK